MNWPTATMATVRQPECQNRKVCWLGCTDNELGWLYQKIRGWQTGGATPFEVEVVVGDNPWTELENLAECGVGRVVIACGNRWEYPWNNLQEFQKKFPEVPVALAMSDWWMGARRTGIGHLRQLPHLCLNWYRWWDGWVPWLQVSSNSQFGPFPSPIAFDRSQNQFRLLQPTILLVAQGERATYSWSTALSGQCRLRISVQACIRQALDDLQAGESLPELILWDDSRLPTCHGPETCLKHASEELVYLQERFPQSRLLVAWTLPRWNVVQGLSRAGIQFELLAKPFFSNFSSAALLRI